MNILEASCLRVFFLLRWDAKVRKGLNLLLINTDFYVLSRYLKTQPYHTDRGSVRSATVGKLARKQRDLITPEPNAEEEINRCRDEWRHSVSCRRTPVRKYPIPQGDLSVAAPGGLA